MENFDDINQKRKSLVDHESAGHIATEYFYAKRDDKAVNQKSAVKNKSLSINVRMSKQDLQVFEFLAGVFKEPRASMIAELLSHDIAAMFNALGMAERTQLALHVDEQITKQGFNHEYNNGEWDGSWFWKVAMPDPDAYNPANHKNWDFMKANFGK